MPYVKHIRRSFLLLSVITNTLASKEIKEKKGSTYKETHTHTNIFTNSLSLSVNWGVQIETILRGKIHQPKTSVIQDKEEVTLMRSVCPFPSIYLKYHCKLFSM